MNVTHHLRIYARDHDNSNIECLCDRVSGILIISSILHHKLEERYFVEFRDLLNQQDEKLKGYKRDGSCYYTK